jgi:hypothetical protein
MSMGSAGRLAGSAAAVIILAGSGVAAGAGAAFAAPASSSHTVTYSCKIPVLGSKSVATKLTLNAPAKSTVGKTVTVSVSFAPSGLPSFSVTNVSLKSSLTESGAQKGSVNVSAHLAKANSATVKASLSGKVKLTKAGKVSFTAAKTASFSVDSSFGKFSFSCTATTKKLPVLGTISVGKAAKAKGVAPARVG